MVRHDFYMFRKGRSPKGMWPAFMFAGLLGATADLSVVAEGNPMILPDGDFARGLGVRDELSLRPTGRWGTEFYADFCMRGGCNGVSNSAQLMAALGLPRRLGGFVMVMSLAEGVHSQPHDPFNGRSPFWYHHACIELASLRARGHDMGEVMNYLLHVVGSRPDPPYFLWFQNLLGDFEAILHEYDSRAGLPQVVGDDVQTWCRYVDQQAHREFMSIAHPRQQAELMDLARYVDDFEIDLEEEDHEGDGERRQRVAFNQRRKLPMLVAQLHGLGERASSSATRPTWVLPPEPPVELDERATTWEAWCCEAVHDIQGWVNAGCDVSEVIQAIADLILARGIEAYTPTPRPRVFGVATGSSAKGPRSTPACRLWRLGFHNGG